MIVGAMIVGDMIVGAIRLPRGDYTVLNVVLYSITKSWNS